MASFRYFYVDGLRASRPGLIIFAALISTALAAPATVGSELEGDISLVIETPHLPS